jgi:predicted HTH transcriptional regulator
MTSLIALFVLLFIASGAVGYFSGMTLLRKYFLFSQTRPYTVEEAIRLGEGPSVEFKRSISHDSPNSVEQVLQTIVAFLNSGDGTMFIGIEDDQTIRGVPVQSPQEKDRFAQKIYHVARQRIRPSPAIQVDFAEASGLAICRIFVPRGEEPLYYLDGVIYVRYGPTDIKAQPEIVKKLLAEYAF